MKTRQSIFGVLLTAFIAVTAFFIHGLPFAPFTIDGRHPIDALLIAIILGMIARNTIDLPSIVNPGIKYSVKKILPFAIVLMGAKLNFVYVLEVSAQALWISILCVFVALALTIWLCQKMGVSQKLGILIAINKKKLTTGIITDGQIRRSSQRNNLLIELSVKKVMTKNPISVDKDMLAVKGLAIMSEKKITSLCVHKKNSPKKTIGVLHIHNILDGNVS